MTITYSVRFASLATREQFTNALEALVRELEAGMKKVKKPKPRTKEGELEL